MTVLEIYEGSDGEATKALYARLADRGALGEVALNLFRAQKCSSRAKVYRGGRRGMSSYRSMAYDRKAWSMGNLCEILAKHKDELGIRYGWKADPNTVFGGDASWVLYIDLPNGQVSFHAPNRGTGPDYPGEWDGRKLSADRIIQFVDGVLA